jgi:sigma-E factor negative regulatory protein RseC
MDYKQKEEKAYIHSGVISQIKRGSVIVSLDTNVHCESCHAKGACGVSDSAEKVVEIADSDGRYTLNEPVEVILKKNLGHKAVFWAYVFPFILMLGTLLTASYFLAEWLAGVLSLLILIPYYLLIHGLKSYFKRTFDISIQRILES